MQHVRYVKLDKICRNMKIIFWNSFLQPLCSQRFVFFLFY